MNISHLSYNTPVGCVVIGAPSHPAKPGERSIRLTVLQYGRVQRAEKMNRNYSNKRFGTQAHVLSIYLMKAQSRDSAGPYLFLRKILSEQICCRQSACSYHTDDHASNKQNTKKPVPQNQNNAHEGNHAHIWLLLAVQQERSLTLTIIFAHQNHTKHHKMIQAIL